MFSGSPNLRFKLDAIVEAQYSIQSHYALHKRHEQFKTIFKLLAFIVCEGKALIKQRMLGETLSLIHEAGGAENIKKWSEWTPSELSLMGHDDELPKVALIGGSGTGIAHFLESHAMKIGEKNILFAIYQKNPDSISLLQLQREAQFENTKNLTLRTFTQLEDLGLENYGSAHICLENIDENDVPLKDLRNIKAKSLWITIRKLNQSTLLLLSDTNPINYIKKALPGWNVVHLIHPLRRSKAIAQMIKDNEACDNNLLGNDFDSTLTLSDNMPLGPEPQFIQISEGSVKKRLLYAFKDIADEESCLIIVNSTGMLPTLHEVLDARQTTHYEKLAQGNILVAIEAVRSCRPNNKPPLLWFSSDHAKFNNKRKDIKEWMKKNIKFTGIDLITDEKCAPALEADVVIYIGSSNRKFQVMTKEEEYECIKKYGVQYMSCCKGKFVHIPYSIKQIGSEEMISIIKSNEIDPHDLNSCLSSDIEQQNKVLDYIKNLQEKQSWHWLTSYPKKIKLFYRNVNVIEAIFQTMKVEMNQSEFESAMKTLAKQFDEDKINMLHLLLGEQGSLNQVASVWMMLQHGVKTQEEYVKKNDLVTLSNFNLKENYTTDYTILHLLSHEPDSPFHMASILTMLQKGVHPHLKNYEGKTFIEMSPIKAKLSQRIQQAPNDWALGFLQSWGCSEGDELMSSWITLADDDLLSDIFKRLTQYLNSDWNSQEFNNFVYDHKRDLFMSQVGSKAMLSSLSSLQQNFEPICSARKIWREQFSLPQSTHEFLAFTAKYHDNDESKLKEVCKRYLSDAEQDNLNISAPVFAAIKKFTVKLPSLGHYIKKLFLTFMGLTLLLRFIDAVSDITLAVTYKQDWNTVLGEFLNQTLCSSLSQPCIYSNVTHMKELCMKTEWQKRLPCSFISMSSWIPWTITVIIMVITYLYEVFTTNNFSHYFAVFSGICCEDHKRGWATAYRFILPLFQQILALIYNHWVSSFCNYWQAKSKKISSTKNSKEDKVCERCKCHKEEVCLFCGRNARNTVKLDQLKAKGEEVVNHSKTVVASTENLFMPMIQFAFLFPTIVVLLSNPSFGKHNFCFLESDIREHLVTLYVLC